jgi:hypothetical protein
LKQNGAFQASFTVADLTPVPILCFWLVKLPAKGVMNVAFKSDPAAAPQESLVFGCAIPERKDDFAWGNKVVAYRIYGPALEATGEISSGIDVWSTRIPNFVVNSFYKQDHEAAIMHNSALSYHNDNGIGLDSYDLGPSRGCAGTAVWADEKLNVSKNYTIAKILATGPVRFEFEVSYAPWLAVEEWRGKPSGSVWMRALI